MTHSPGLRLLMADDAVAVIGAYTARVPSLCVKRDNLLAQQLRRAMHQVAS
jgi:hypothetical protein